MEQFSLEKWLQDKSRKIYTRDGREVTIEKTDIHIHGMSHMILGKYSDIYEMWHSNGRINYTGSDCNLDLFFADEEKELTEFEKELEMMMVSFSNGNLGSDVRKEMPKPKLHNYAKDLLDLARKELENNDWRQSLRYYKDTYEQGKRDALKDLPKWKKVPSGITRKELFNMMHKGIVTVFNGYKDYYYFDKTDLEKLPKEE